MWWSALCICNGPWADKLSSLGSWGIYLDLMQVDRIINCRLDSFSFREGKRSIDTLPWIIVTLHSFSLSILEKQAESRAERLWRTSMYNHWINRKSFDSIPWMCLISVCCWYCSCACLLLFMLIFFMLHMWLRIRFITWENEFQLFLCLGQEIPA